jgi:hypothetical protein
VNIGVLGHGSLASVDGRGAVNAGDLSLDWLVGADDRWHVPADESAVRQQRVTAAPVVETAVRVPGGEVVERVYGAAAAAGAVVVMELDNQSPVPLTVVIVVRIARRGPVGIDGMVLRIDGVPALVFSRAPGAWAAGPAAGARVIGGGAHTGPFEALAAPVEIALLFPVPHRTCVRTAVSAARETAAIVPVEVRDLPGADAVARGWDRQLERGLQATLPPPVGELVDGARADLLLASRRDPNVVAALEDWGFDDEAASGWAALNWSARRRARRRASEPDLWPAVRASDARDDPARFLAALRAVLVREGPGAVELLPGFPTDWLGQPLTIDAVPLRAGTLSFAVRWHGARPALLWDAPPGVELCAPALDSRWSSNAGAGETLLAEPPASLLPMGSQERSAGEPVEAPGQFS